MTLLVPASVYAQNPGGGPGMPPEPLPPLPALKGETEPKEKAVAAETKPDLTSGDPGNPAEPKSEPGKQETSSASAPKKRTTAEAASSAPAPEDKAKATPEPFKGKDFIPSFGQRSRSLLLGKKALKAYLAHLTELETAAHYEETPTPEAVLAAIEEANRSAKKPLTNVRYPYFHVSALVYDSPQQWKLRINDLRYTQDDRSHHFLTIEDITADRVTISWQPRDIRVFSEAFLRKDPGDRLEAWKKQVRHRKITDAKAEDGRIQPGVESLKMTLEPNQLFFSKTMAIYEGQPRAMFPESWDALSEDAEAENRRGPRRRSRRGRSSSEVGNVIKLPTASNPLDSSAAQKSKRRTRRLRRRR